MPKKRIESSSSTLASPKPSGTNIPKTAGILLSPERKKIVSGWISHHLQSIDIDKAAKQHGYHNFHVSRSAIRVVGAKAKNPLDPDSKPDTGYYRLIIAFKSEDKEFRAAVKAVARIRIDSYQSTGDDFIQTFDNLNCQYNRHTVNILFQEFQESHTKWSEENPTGWTKQEFDEAWKMIALALKGKSILMVRGKKSAAGIDVNGKELFAQHIEDAVLTMPEPESILTNIISKLPNGLSRAIADATERSAKGVYHHRPEVLSQILDPLTGAALSIGRSLQGPSIN